MPGASCAIDSTERGRGNVADTGASGAERRSLRPRARPTTVFAIGAVPSMWSRSESRVSAFPRLLGSKGFPETLSLAGSGWPPTLVVGSTAGRSSDSPSTNFKPMRFVVRRPQEAADLDIRRDRSLVSALAFDRRRATKLPEYSHPLARRCQPDGFRASSPDRHRRIRFLREGRPSRFRPSGSLRAGPQDAKERSCRESRTSGAVRR